MCPDVWSGFFDSKQIEEEPHAYIFRKSYTCHENCGLKSNVKPRVRYSWESFLHSNWWCHPPWLTQYTPIIKWETDQKSTEMKTACLGKLFNWSECPLSRVKSLIFWSVQTLDHFLTSMYQNVVPKLGGFQLFSSWSHYCVLEKVLQFFEIFSETCALTYRSHSISFPVLVHKWCKFHVTAGLATQQSFWAE